MFTKNLFQLIETIEFTYSNKYFAPCLTLIYSGIDIAASLDRQGKNSKQAFLDWTKEYVLSQNDFDCTALEIYAARCGLVHTFTAQSNLSVNDKARMIIYSWGDADPQKVDEVREDLDRDDLVVVHIDDLKQAFELGLADFFKELSEDSEKRERVKKQAGLWFTNTNKKLIDKYLEAKNSAR